MALRRSSSKVERLSVFMNGVPVGQLVRKPSGALSFSYERSWLDRPTPIAISRGFGLREKPYEGQTVRDYFENLLPDDRRVREQVAARAQAGGTGAFDLLAAVGRDCVGALQFYPAEEKAAPVQPVRGRPASAAGIGELLRNLHINPLGITRDQDFRISIAGAQSKTALLRIGKNWFYPEGATPTTHILKPSIGPISEGPDLSLSVENEWLCLRILQAFGLPAAEAEILELGGTKVLAVERFDRRWSGDKLYRLPQEDVCQALRLGPERKYEADQGPGIREILDLLNESDKRDADREQFMKAQLIFWLIAAIDGHAKNFSLALRPHGFCLTPLYDVMSADPHINKKSLPIQKVKLAMSVGNKHYKVSEILPRHWVQTATRCKFKGIESIMSEVVRQVPEVIAQVSGELTRTFPAQISDGIFRAMTARGRKLGAG